MDPIYVFGHKNPDTDSVVSALAYASLMNAVGEGNYIPARLGHCNDETNFLLKRFGFEAPVYLHTVRTQVHDIDFDVPPLLNARVPMSYAWDVLRKNANLSSLPVTDEEGTLYGVITSGLLAECDMASINTPIVSDVPVYNLLSALEGRIINDEEDLFDAVSGEVVIALPGTAAPIQSMNENCIVICGSQPDVIEQAINAGASCVIICQADIDESYRGRSTKTCLIVTPCDAYRAARMIFQAGPVGRIAIRKDVVHFHLDDYIDDVRETVLKSRFRSYPVLDENDKVVGTLSRYHLLRPKRKKVVLVDHNETSQSVSGLDQADIMAILDHHRLADVQTGNPIYMRNEPVGSTTSIVATMYQEYGLMPTPKLAGLMAAAILSDTVLFKSPTCTPRDRRLAERLSRIAGIDLDTLGRDMFSNASGMEKSAKELLMSDFKEFHLSDHAIGIGQVSSLNSLEMLSRQEEFLSEMNAMRQEKQYDMVLLMLTDVLREGTELVFCGDPEIVNAAFGCELHDEKHLFLPGVMSRKKQIVPALSALWG